MLLRDSSSGAFTAEYISGNSITGSAVVGTVGLNWNFSGTGNFDGEKQPLRAVAAQQCKRLV